MRPLAPAVAEMKRLYVAPGGRGLGLGRALVQALVEAARVAGAREIRLDTLPEMTTAQALYARFGFHPVAPYYDSPVTGTRFLALTLAG
jgi:ribosomal protein S18 acetylase RimI-like enzyme